jgi:hypothetical protein
MNNSSTERTATKAISTPFLSIARAPTARIAIIFFGRLRRAVGERRPWCRGGKRCVHSLAELQGKRAQFWSGFHHVELPNATGSTAAGEVHCSGDGDVVLDLTAYEKAGDVCAIRGWRVKVDDNRRRIGGCHANRRFWCWPTGGGKWCRPWCYRSSSLRVQIVDGEGDMLTLSNLVFYHGDNAIAFW